MHRRQRQFAKVFWFFFSKKNCLLAFLFLSLVLPLAAQAQTDPFAGFSADSFDDVSNAATALALSGNQRAEPVLRALRSRHLVAAEEGPGLFIETDAGLIDARTGAASSVSPDDTKPVSLNNHVREAVDRALALLDLHAADPSLRSAAAQTLFDLHDPVLLGALDTVIAREGVASVKTQLEEARAAALLSSSGVIDSTQALGAVAVLRARGGLPARGLLAGITGQSPAVMDAARSAVAAIDWRLRAWSLGQDLFYGLSLSSVLLLAAMGLAITFGVMGVINMAHGELVMIGAYVTYVVQQGVLAVLPGAAGLSLILSVPAAFVVCAAIGVAIERSLIRFLYGRPLETLLATWGLSLVLQQAVRSLFGPTNISVITPQFLSGALHVGGLVITLNRLAIIIFAIAVMVALQAVLRRTALGLEMRAVTQNRRMAALMGIRTPRVDALTFGLGSGVAGLAGVAISQIDNVSPNLGQGYIIDSFMVVVFGGVGNLLGTLAGAVTLGLSNKVLEPAVGAVLGKIVVLVLLIFFIQLRPRGMFPLRGRAVES
jgi:urea transport system permease protein